MANGGIGSVSVQVVPNADNFWRDFEARTRGGADAAGRQYGDAFGRAAGARLAELLNGAVRTAGQGAGNQGRESGRRYGDAFGRSVAERIEAATRAIGPRVRIDADTDPAVAELENLRRRIRETDAHLRIGRIDDATAVAQLDELRAKLARLAASSTDIRVRVNAAAAAAELAALRAEIDRVQDGTKRTTGEFSLMRDAILLLGPAAIPAAAALTGLAAGLAAQAGVAILAVQGIKKELGTASIAGLTFGKDIGTLKADLGDLEMTAANGVLSGFDKAAHNLHDLMPSLNQTVGVLSVQLGSIAQHSITGLIGGFQTFAPLLQTVGQYLDGLAARFQKFATGSGGAQFAATLTAEFNRVMPVLEHVIEAFSHLIAAVSPAGGAVLAFVDVLARFVNILDKIPGGLTLVLTGLLALKVSSTVAILIGNLSTKLATMGAAGGLGAAGLNRASAGLSGLASKAGIVAGVAYAVYALGQAVNSAANKNHSFSDSMDNAGKATAAYGAALAATNGKVDESVQSAIQAQLANAGLTDKAGKAGITADQLSVAIAGTDEQFASLVETWKKSGKPAGDTIAALAIQRVQFKGAQAEAQKYAGASRDVGLAMLAQQADFAATKDTLAQIASIYGYSTDQATKYAAVLGITAEKLKSGAVTTGELQTAIDEVGPAFNNATQAGSGFIAALTQFGQSAGGAADKAALIGAYLKAAQGDALGYTGALAGVTAANNALVDAFQADRDKITSLSADIQALGGSSNAASLKNAILAAQANQTATALSNQQGKAKLLQGELNSGNLTTKQSASVHQQLATAQASAATAAARLATQQTRLSQATGVTNAAKLAVTQDKLAKAYRDSERAAIDLNTGTINYAKGGAPALVGQLQAIQDAAVKAAEATYQHEVGTKGAGKAAEDAAKIFKTSTLDALKSDATQLGLTNTQASKLATTYFSLPSDVTTQVKSIGLSDLNKTLENIGIQLSYLTGKPFPVTVDAKTDVASRKIAALQAQIDKLTGKVPLNVLNGLNKQKDQAGALNANGSVMSFYKDGGLNLPASVKHFADGAHVAQIAPAGAWRVFAEPETGGEAYIPMASSKRARSEAILAEVADRFGLALAPKQVSTSYDQSRHAVVNQSFHYGAQVEPRFVDPDAYRRAAMALG